MAAADAASLFEALRLLTLQVQAIAEKSAGGGGGGGGGRRWDALERFKNLSVFGGNPKEYEEWSVKFRSVIRAGDARVGQLMSAIEKECSEERLLMNKYDQLEPEFDRADEMLIIQSSAEMYNLLLNVTTGEANAVVRRSLGAGWLAWKRLTSSLNPRTLASGIRAISSVLTPPKVTHATKADQTLDEWEDKIAKLSTEYGQELTSKVKVAVLYAMMPKDMQEKILDACAVNWDDTSEADAGQLYMKIKTQLRNLAKARREIAGPRPMEVDRVSAWEWSEPTSAWAGGWGDPTEDAENAEEDQGGNEAYIQYIGKGGGKKGGKGFQGSCWVCGEFGHSQWDCAKGKGKGKGKDGKGYEKGNGYKGYGYKGFGKGDQYGKGNWYAKGSGDQYGKGNLHTKGSGKGGMPRACFGCGSLEHLMRDCPDNPRVQQVEEEPETLFIGNVREEWKLVPMKVRLKPVRQAKNQADYHWKHQNGFKVFEADEDDDGEEEIVQVRAVERVGEENGRGERGAGSALVHSGRNPMILPEVHKPPGGSLARPAVKSSRVKMTEAYEGCQGRCRGTRCQDPTHEEQAVKRDMEKAGTKIQEEVVFVQTVDRSETMVSLGVGDIIVDSAADESCWPVGLGDAYPTKTSSRAMRLKTANGGDMQHYGEKEVLFKYEGGEKRDPIGIRFQVTDVRKPLLAVRRLVEKGNMVVLAGEGEESYIMNRETKVKIPVKKKGGSFVIEAHFVKQGFMGQA